MDCLIDWTELTGDGIDRSVGFINRFVPLAQATKTDLLDSFSKGRGMIIECQGNLENEEVIKQMIWKHVKFRPVKVCQKLLRHKVTNQKLKTLKSTGKIKVYDSWYFIYTHSL